MSSLKRIKIPNEVKASLAHFPPLLKQKVRYALDQLLTHPEEGKFLKAELSGLCSLRVGKFRIIYRSQETHLEIIAIGPRSTIYEEASRSIRLGNLSFPPKDSAS